MHKGLGFSDEDFIVCGNDFDYEDYAVKVFGISEEDADVLTEGSWSHIDNSAYGAGQRLLYLLKTGEVVRPKFDAVEKYKDLKLEDFTSDDWKNELKESL